MAKTSNPKKYLRAAYSGARKADPRPITGKETPAELLEHAFAAYVGRQERTAFELMQRVASRRTLASSSRCRAR